MIVFGGGRFLGCLDLEYAHKYLLEPLVIRFFLELEIPDVVKTLSELLGKIF